MDSSERDKPTLSRRSLLLGGASAAVLVAVLPFGAGALAPMTVEAFRALSARLADAQLGELNRGAAAKLLDALLASGRGAELEALAAGPGLGSGPLADTLVAAWYSGSYETAEGLASFGLTHALLWDALDFTKPPGLCGGTTGYWADPPEV